MRSPSLLLAPAVGAAKLQRLAPVRASLVACSARAGARQTRWAFKSLVVAEAGKQPTRLHGLTRRRAKLPATALL